MLGKYTQDASQMCFDLIGADNAKIWADIEALPEDSEKERWERKLQSIADEYVLSARFALMRLLLQRAEELLLDANQPEAGFQIVLNGETYQFTDITMAHAEALSRRELGLYEKLLLELASQQEDFELDTDRELIRKALKSRRRDRLLSWEEAIQLGHILDLKLEEMEWFLLRVFDVEGGFRYNRSADLIDAYGFLTHSGCRKIAALKAYYIDRCGEIPKVEVDEKALYGTQDNEGFLPEIVCSQAENAEDSPLDAQDLRQFEDWLEARCGKRFSDLNWAADCQDMRFMRWMEQRAPELDLISQTALRVYRNLAIYAYHLTRMEDASPDVDVKRQTNSYAAAKTDFVREIRKIVTNPELSERAKHALYEGDTISLERCREVTGRLLRANKNLALSELGNPAIAWETPVVAQNGQKKLMDAKREYTNDGTESEFRITAILSGQQEIEKPDLLYLIWFVSNLCWFNGKIGQLTPEEVTGRLHDFCDAAEDCLEAASLPAFYPPHLMERSMMLAIVRAYTKGDSNTELIVPAEEYELICSAIRRRRNRQHR